MEKQVENMKDSQHAKTVEFNYGQKMKRINIWTNDGEADKHLLWQRITARFNVHVHFLLDYMYKRDQKSDEQKMRNELK